MVDKKKGAEDDSPEEDSSNDDGEQSRQEDSSDSDTNIKYKAKKKKQRKGKDSRISIAFKRLTKNPKVKPGVLQEPTYDCFIETFKEKEFTKIITMVGAGVSTSAGVPDFRSPNQGLYERLVKYNLPTPQAIFDIGHFMKNPSAFYCAARNLIPRDFKPTYSHYFVKLLETKGLLLRHYTQNVDGLERKAGISENKLIEAHGTFSSAHCSNCEVKYSLDWLTEQMHLVGVPECVACNSLVKPDIIFFGEILPTNFFECSSKDFQEADLLIIMGSSLTVEPFASLARRPAKDCPRVIINNHPVGRRVGILYNSRRNKRDVFIQGTCDDGCKNIVNSMGWEADIQALMKQQEGDRK